MLGVHVARVDVVQRLLLGEALGAVAEPELGARELHEILGVALVEDREVAGEAGLGAEAPEEAVGGAVERAAVHAAAGAPDEAFRAGEHLLGDAAREGEEEDALRRDAALDEVRDAVDERARLAGAGAGDDEEGAVAVGGRLALGLVELRGEVHRALGGDLARSCRVGAGVGAHGGNIPRTSRPPRINPVPRRTRCAASGSRCHASSRRARGLRSSPRGNPRPAARN
jgi:hypothetical protein